MRQSSRSIWSLAVSMASRTGSTLANPRSSAKLNGAPPRGVETVLTPTPKSSARNGCGSGGLSGSPGENTAPEGVKLDRHAPVSATLKRMEVRRPPDGGMGDS